LINIFYFILQISSLIRQFSSHEPIFVIIDVRPGVEGLPTTAYEAVEEVEAEGKEIQKVFKHITCSVEAEEAEEVIYAHLMNICICIDFSKVLNDILTSRIQN
jgi:26S proteasome regulatory subunit N8